MADNYDALAEGASGWQEYSMENEDCGEHDTVHPWDWMDFHYENRKNTGIVAESCFDAAEDRGGDAYVVDTEAGAGFVGYAAVVVACSNDMMIGEIAFDDYDFDMGDEDVDVDVSDEWMGTCQIQKVTLHS